jgi:hypothetical protein
MFIGTARSLDWNMVNKLKQSVMCLKQTRCLAHTTLPLALDFKPAAVPFRLWWQNLLLISSSTNKDGMCALLLPYFMVKVTHALCDEMLFEWRQESRMWCVAALDSFHSSLVARCARCEAVRSTVSHWGWWRLNKLSGGEGTHFYFLLQSKFGNMWWDF